MTNNNMKEYTIIAKFKTGPMAGNTMEIGWIGAEPLVVGSTVNQGEHKFKVLSCKEVIFEEDEG